MEISRTILSALKAKYFTLTKPKFSPNKPPRENRHIHTQCIHMMSDLKGHLLGRRNEKEKKPGVYAVVVGVEKQRP